MENGKQRDIACSPRDWAGQARKVAWLLTSLWKGLVGAVPLRGDLFVGFRANRRNGKVLRDYFVERSLV
jgi:hypothetical protein